MSVLSWLFGGGEPKRTPAPASDRGASTCSWNHPDALPLAPGRGFTFEVVGEAQWQDNLSAICGGKCEEGHKREVPAQLLFESNDADPSAVRVMIEGRPVGWMPPEKAAEVRSALSALNAERRAVTCKAKIVGGWDRGGGDEGHFGVKLSLAWPLKVRSARK